ncbi:hypothetical protein [Nonomuraea endophytica]|uniref:Uncharacterized protein n=1 Tax=Nonomuraea endophytica TaxID=714136 RepID=A0A7W8AES3_9ACTN|nr:hypothetical protein [Nonomuraea endophytica]MBB5084847.1 hypothetical protein [Nonomuraea endophytica]
MSRRRRLQRPWDPPWLKIAGVAAGAFSAVFALLSLVGDEIGRADARKPSPTPMEVASPGAGVAKPRAAAVPDRFIGTWIGLVDDEDMDTPFPVEILLRRGGLGQIVGKVRYESLKCAGVVRLFEVSSRKLSVQESLTVATEQCDDDLVTLKYQANGTLYYTYGDGEGRAVLSRQGQ